MFTVSLGWFNKSPQNSVAINSGGFLLFVIVHGSLVQPDSFFVLSGGSVILAGSQV